MSGVVSRVLRHGLLVAIDNSPLRAFVDQKECADEPIADLSAVYSENDRVTLVVLRVDARKRRIDASLRPSLLPAPSPFAVAASIPAEPVVDSDVEPIPEADEDSAVNATLGSTANSGVNSGVNSTLNSGANSGVNSTLNSTLNSTANSTAALSSTSESRLDSAVPAEEGLASSMEVEPSLSASTGFGWEDFAPAAASPASPASPARPSRPSRLPEAEVAARERSLAQATAQPASESDFERLLASRPTSSELWIRYASWFLALAEPARARAVLRRALQTVPGHLEDERANLWLALLNLESECGDDEALRAAFAEARQAMDPRRAGLHLAALLEARQKWPDAYAVWRQLARENRGDVKVWLGWCECFLKQGLARESGETLRRAQEAVGASEKARLLSGYAILLYRYKQNDQGRTIFEDLVSTLKNRLDLWNLYVDQETKAGNVEYVRGLFRRMEGLKMSVNSAKRVFKKWIAFEDAHGDEEHAAQVEEEVQRYIDRLTAK